MSIGRTEADLAREKIAGRPVSAFAIEFGHDAPIARNEQAVKIVGPACHGFQDLAKSIGIYACVDWPACLPAVTKSRRCCARRRESPSWGGCTHQQDSKMQDE
jgi:hypothetical protein